MAEGWIRWSGWGLLCAALGGCAPAVPLVPDDYRGGVAVIRDSVRAYAPHHADLFYLTAVDARPVATSLDSSRFVSGGIRMVFRPVVMERRIRAQPAAFGVRGHTNYAPQLRLMERGTCRVDGTVRFTPEAGHRYVVRGEIAGSRCAIWIEDEVDQRQMGDRVEGAVPAARPRG